MTAIGVDDNDPASDVNIQQFVYNYYTIPSVYGPPHITNLYGPTNGNRFGLVHMTMEIQATSSTIRPAPYDCPTGCISSGSLPLNVYNKDFSLTNPGSLFGPGNLRPLLTSTPGPTPDAGTVPLLKELGFGSSTSTPGGDDPRPGMFVYSHKNLPGPEDFLSADIAFFLGLKRIPEEKALRRLAKAVLHKFGSNSYAAGDYGDIL